MKNICFIIGVMVFLNSCSKLEEESLASTNLQCTRSSMNVSNTELKSELSKALAKVLNENRDVRELIKREALKKFDYDYDVLYALVKDVKLGNGNTLKRLLANYLDENYLSKIENEMPTLTIFVPSLPEHSFSAESWNVETEIPDVAFRTNETNDITSYDATGKEYIINDDLIPGYPIIVLKENERVVVSTIQTKSLESSAIMTTDQGTTLTFISDVFNNTKKYEPESLSQESYSFSNDKGVYQTTANIEHVPSENEKKIFEAYDHFPDPNDWQRDYVYYSLTKENTQGSFDLRYKEYLIDFQILGNAEEALNRIADQTGDPKIDGKWHERRMAAGRSVMTGWSDGELEFKVTYCLGGVGPSATSNITYFRVDPYKLFKLEPEKDYIQDKNNFRLKSVEALCIPVKLPLFEWNIRNYSTSITINIAEEDLSQTIETATSYVSKIAANFTVDPLGNIIKNGLKLGGTMENSVTNSYKITTTLESDDLGTVIVNFGDQIILSKSEKEYPSIYGSGRSSAYRSPDYNNKYYTGYYRIHIAPLLAN